MNQKKFNKKIKKLALEILKVCDGNRNEVVLAALIGAFQIVREESGISVEVEEVPHDKH